MKLEFNPKKVGNLELGWWRAHNDKDRPRMFQLLVEQHMELYGMTSEEANHALKLLASGIQYHDVRDWDGARNAASDYYRQIKTKTGLSFNPRIMGELEVGWWILHDQLEENPDKSQLAAAFSKLYATHYAVDPALLTNAGELRAQATYEHDLAEIAGITKEEIETHWTKTGELLVNFYSELKEVVNREV